MNHLLLPSFASPVFRDERTDASPYMLDMWRAEAEAAVWARRPGTSRIAALIARLRVPGLRPSRPQA